MTRADLHIKKLQQLVFLLAVFVSLAPCTVKESLFNSLDLAYERPLNKNRTVQNQNSQCVAEVFAKTATDQEIGKISVALPGPTEVSIPLPSIGPQQNTLSKHTKKPLGNGPPIYILYKRLKFDMA